MNSAQKVTLCIIIIIELALICGFLGYIVHLSDSTSYQAVENLNKTVQNITETAKLLGEFQEWLNVTRLLREFLNSTAACPLC